MAPIRNSNTASSTSLFPEIGPSMSLAEAKVPTTNLILLPGLIKEDRMEGNKYEGQKIVAVNSDSTEQHLGIWAEFCIPFHIR